jgi:cardiolipin synthase C
MHNLRCLMSIGIFLFAAGCAGPKVADLPAEIALPPVQSAFWDDIANAQSGEWFYLLNSGDEALEWRLRMIDSATSSIDMETFLWSPDYSGRLVQAHILAAADRGVRVRFLLDDSFTMHEDLALHAFDDHPNIELRIYNPLRHRSDSVLWRQLFNLGEFARINHRMHNKLLVVDGQAALVGGRNLADEYFGLDETMNFRDMEVITMGSSVPGTVRHFDAFWNSGWAFPLAAIFPEPAEAPSLDEGKQGLAAGISIPAEVDRLKLQTAWQGIAGRAMSGTARFHFDEPASRDPAAPDEAPDQLAAQLQQLIDNARSEVTLVSAYLVPTPEFEQAIRSAEERGVEVRILTNSLKSNNHLAAHAAYWDHIDALVDSGVDLYEVRFRAADRHLYMEDPVDEKQLGLHAKMLLIDDDITFIGSCNLDSRSLVINTEVGLIINSIELNQQMRELLAIDFLPRNAWQVQRGGDGKLVWRGENDSYTGPPDASQIERLEDWFIGLLPINKQM